ATGIAPPWRGGLRETLHADERRDVLAVEGAADGAGERGLRRQGAGRAGDGEGERFGPRGRRGGAPAGPAQIDVTRSVHRVLAAGGEPEGVRRVVRRAVTEGIKRTEVARLAGLPARAHDGVDGVDLVRPRRMHVGHDEVLVLGVIYPDGLREAR